MVPSATDARAATSEIRATWKPFSAKTEMAASRIRWYLSPTTRGLEPILSRGRLPLGALIEAAFFDAEQCRHGSRDSAASGQDTGKLCPLEDESSTNLQRSTPQARYSSNFNL